MPPGARCGHDSTAAASDAAHFLLKAAEISAGQAGLVFGDRRIGSPA